MTVATLSSGRLTVQVSSLGAELQSIVDDRGRDLLWNGDPAIWSGRAPILFPIVGELANGRYRFKGRAYDLPRHGFARRSEFEIMKATPEEALMRLRATDATRKLYPFEFRLEIGFLLAADRLRIKASIFNDGDEAMPASLGFHPAFRWPLPFGSARSDHRIRFDLPELNGVRRIDSTGLLRPARVPTPVAGNLLILDDTLFHDDVIIFDQLNSRDLAYGAASGPQLHIRFENLPFLGLWTKPGAGFICIEPWQGHADPEGFAGDIRDKPGVIEIAPRASREFTMAVALSDA